MSKTKYKKAIKSFDKRIAEHIEKQKYAKSSEQFHYWEQEIQKFKKEKRKRQERL